MAFEAEYKNVKEGWKTWFQPSTFQQAFHLGEWTLN